MVKVQYFKNDDEVDPEYYRVFPNRRYQYRHKWCDHWSSGIDRTWECKQRRVCASIRPIYPVSKLEILLALGPEALKIERSK